MRKLFSFILSLLAPIARCNELDLCWELIAGLSRIKCAIAAFVNSANKCHVSTAILVLNSFSGYLHQRHSPEWRFGHQISHRHRIGTFPPTGLTAIVGRFDISALGNLVELDASHLKIVTVGISMRSLDNLQHISFQNLLTPRYVFESLQLTALMEL